jgi:hypothetical protein
MMAARLDEELSRSTAKSATMTMVIVHLSSPGQAKISLL